MIKPFRAAAPARIAAEVEQLAQEPDLSGAHAVIARTLAGLDDGGVRRAQNWVRETLGSLPIPLTRSKDDSLYRKRLVLRLVRAELRARHGQPEELLPLQIEMWRDHGSSLLPYIEHLRALGRDDEAAVWARYVLGKKDCRDRAAIESALMSIAAPPDGWREAVLAFAAEPSLEAWECLMRFTPADSLYHRIRNTLQLLMSMDVDANILFRCATRYGTTPDAIELVESGGVDPATVVQRGAEGPPQARGLWLGLAARAALAGGDRLGTVRLLREACLVADPSFPPLLEIRAIREQADVELTEMLDNAGIPRFERSQ